MRAMALRIAVLSFAMGVLVHAQTEQSSKTNYVDTHTHFNAKSAQGVRPQQDGESGNASRKGPPGRPGGRTGNATKPARGAQADLAAAYDAAAEQLIAEMDKYGVQKALVMPPPQIPEQGSVCNYKDIAVAVGKHAGRLYFLGGGDSLNRIIHQCKPGEATPDVRSKFNEIAEEIASSGAKGFGEMSVLHLSLISSRHAYQEAAADHPLFLMLADIAARHEMPIDLHMEAVVQDMKLPESLSDNPKNPPILHANIPAFERLLAHNRKAKIVWQHIGWDNAGSMTVELLRRLLEAHPNLYLSMRGEERMFDRKGNPRPNRIADGSGNVRPEWLKLIGEFPDRFMAGTDDFFGSSIKAGGRLPTTSKETWGVVAQLPPELAEKVGRANAARVYNLK